MAPSSSGLGHLVFIQEIAGSIPAGVTISRIPIEMGIRDKMIPVNHQTQISKSLFCIYILQSDIDQTFYVGYTGNLDKRFKQHNAGRSTYTSRHRPYKLVYSESFQTKEEAKQREKYIKRYGNIRGFLKSRVPPNTIRD